ncbi:Hsp70 family protein [Schlesneria sp. T3-172]|uniref:Hsp70 family protein n=1 Tax=Schlesneria sphaerica TaxID=3373610 RepID=UPI0037CBECDB
MNPTHAVGIDLGTTYSCIAYLNEHGEPVSIPNKDGELSTASAVFFDGNEAIVGTEALRNSIRHPDRVIVHAKRYMGSPTHRWKIAGKSYSPVDVSTLILKSLLDAAREKLGNITSAVITVPAQFSDVQRQATAEAGKRAGLTHVDIINEPVAAALCFVLGTEGIWFTELATSQTVMVVDLGGGTFDLSLVKYQPNEVSVIASGGDLHLGGLDWNRALETAIGKQFHKEFGVDPMKDRESAQALAMEAEQTKRSLSVRPKAAMTVVAGGQRKTYQVEVEQFERLTKDLVERMKQLTLDLLAERKMGWARVDVVLTTGGSSRMPMVRKMLKDLSGRTLNTSLSPDQSIAHGATYYAGMLLTNNSFAKSILKPQAFDRLAQFKQKSSSARALGVLIRDQETGQRVPNYILPAHTPLPASVKQSYGTVSDNQRRVHLRIVESGTAADSDFVELGDCLIEPLPENLPEGTEIEVTISYDEQARVHVAAKVQATGQEAQTEIVRPENLVVSALHDADQDVDEIIRLEPEKTAVAATNQAPAESINLDFPIGPLAEERKPAAPPAPLPRINRPAESIMTKLEESSRPIPLCNQCGDPIDAGGKCPHCQSPAIVDKKATVKPAAPPLTAAPRKSVTPAATRPDNGTAVAKPASNSSAAVPVTEDQELLDFLRDTADSKELIANGNKPVAASAAKPKIKPPPLPPTQPQAKSGSPRKIQESLPLAPDDDAEFWKRFDP